MGNGQVPNASFPTFRPDDGCSRSVSSSSLVLGANCSRVSKVRFRPVKTDTCAFTTFLCLITSRPTLTNALEIAIPKTLSHTLLTPRDQHSFVRLFPQSRRIRTMALLT